MDTAIEYGEEGALKVERWGTLFIFRSIILQNDWPLRDKHKPAFYPPSQFLLFNQTVKYSLL